MKNKYIFCFILFWLQYETIAQGGLRITWPLDRTVFQRDANGGTDAWFAGEFGYQQLANGGSSVQYYVYPVDKQTGVRSATAIAFSGQVFVNVSNALSSPHGNIKTFFGKLGRLNTGWYDLEVSVTKNIVCGFASNRSAKDMLGLGWVTYLSLLDNRMQVVILTLMIMLFLSILRRRAFLFKHS
ncbi:MAG: hypothetical protein U5M51_08775 [Emticicia sp.]|nr:hypothetical protein [Emticicia sp.]